MRPVEVSTDVTLPPGDVWDFMWGEGGPPRFLADMHTLGYWRDVRAVEGFELRGDGTPRYRMSRTFGPFPPVSMTSVYDVFERPIRAVNHVEDTPLRGDFVATYEPTREGTRVTWRWEVGAANPVLKVLVRLLRPFLVRSLQKDLDEYGTAAKRAGA